MRYVNEPPKDQVHGQGIFVYVEWQECEHGVIKDAAKPCDHKGEQS